MRAAGDVHATGDHYGQALYKHTYSHNRFILLTEVVEGRTYWEHLPIRAFVL